MATTAQTQTADGTSGFAELLKEYVTALPNVGDLVKGTVISIDKGDVRVDIGGMAVGVVRGTELFAESKHFADIQVGDEVEATVVEDENENGEMELSFRVAGHKIVWDKMKKLTETGAPVDARVLQANKGGLLMQLDALVGFLPVSQLSPDNYPRVPGGDKSRILEHLKQFIGKDMRVRVLDALPDDEKLIFSEKALWEDEQKSVLDAYKIGDIIEGEISALTPFGAFVKFGEGLEGLVHISEIVWQRIDHPKDILKVGDPARAQIIDLNKSKIYLSLKRLIDDPWKHVRDRYTVGQVVEGEVHKVEPFGLMVKLDEEIHGLAHISDLSSKRLTDPKEFLSKFTVGVKYKFDIVSIDPAEHRLGLRLEGVEKVEKEEKKEPTAAEAPAETLSKSAESEEADSSEQSVD